MIGHISIERIYEDRRLQNKITLQQRKEFIHTEIPEIKEIEHKIATVSVTWAKLRLNGGQNKQVMNNSENVPTNYEQFHQVIHDLGAQKRELLAAHGYPEDYLEPIYTCQQCKDTGFIGQNHCSCYRQLKVDALFQQYPVKQLLEKQNFQCFDASLYSEQPFAPFKISPRQNILRLKSICSDFVKNFEKSKNNLLFCGRPGVGKTFLTSCIAGELLKQAYSVVYLSAGQLFDTFSVETFGRGPKAEEAKEAIAYVMECDLLIIDDLGTEMTNSFVNAQLFTCVNNRILADKSTIISTNLDMKSMTKAYTERITSRFTEHYKILPVFGDDIRLKKGL